MFKSKYSNFLTIILIVAIVFVIVLVSILAVNAYKRYKNDKDAENAISRFENNIGQNNNTNSSGQNLIEQNVTNDTTGGDTSGKVTRQVTYYNNFVMIGYIEIPKINIKYPILSNISDELLKVSPCRFYGPLPNENGNLCIAAHNYDDNRFFGNLYKLNIGDMINIYDSSNNVTHYYVYDKFESSEKDTSCINQDVHVLKELTLITCNNLNKNRLIIKSKAQK